MKTHTFSATPNAGGGRHAEGVDDGLDEQEGGPHQQLLKGHRCAQPQLSADNVLVEAQVSPGESEGQRPAAQADQEQGDKHADGLGGHGGQGGPGGPHVEPGHQEQVPEDIDDAGDGNGEQRGPGVADPPENGAQDVVGHNKEGAGPADADVQHRLMERVLRRVHEPGQYLGSTHQDGSEQDGEAGEQADAAADGAARILRLPPADPLPHQNGDPHGQAGDNHGDSLEQHAAGGYAGDVRRLGKLAHHQQVHAAVERLQEQCEENRNGKRIRELKMFPSVKLRGRPILSFLLSILSRPGERLCPGSPGGPRHTKPDKFSRHLSLPPYPGSSFPANDLPSERAAFIL